jgi:serine/threonine protein phosphatase 1
VSASRIIAIGDIHGCARALAALLQAIDPQPDDIMIPLGDVIDRGRDSRGALEQLLALRSRCKLIPLIGNHEDMFLGAYSNSVERRAWLYSGGAPMLDSYGSASLDAIPAEHIAFIRSFRPYYETESHIFLHANYLADLPLAEQPPGMLYWEPLQRRTPGPHCSGKTVIVGHSSQPENEVLDLGYLKCLETNCVAGGWLTAFDAASGSLWQADKQGRLRRQGAR